jgi:hypothetical protein
VRKLTVGAALTLASVGLVAGQAGANANDPYRAVSDALIGMTNADPFLVDDGCTGGSGPDDPFIVLSVAPTQACTVAAGIPVVATPAGGFTWLPKFSDAVREFQGFWHDKSAKLVLATIEVDGRPVRAGRHNVASSVTFADSFWGEPDGTTNATFAVVMGATLSNLSIGEHTLHLAFGYSDGFTGDSTITLTVTP